MGYRQRRLEKAEKLSVWAQKRRAKSIATRKLVDSIAEHIPFGQPILVGHHSERRHRADIARINRGLGASIEHARKADDFQRRAATIQAQADRAIYDDDPDAIERLEEKLATLEAARDRMKNFNKTVRKGSPDFAILTPAQADDFRSSAACFSWVARKGFDLANISGNITRTRQRIERLRIRDKRASSRTLREAAGAQIGVSTIGWTGWVDVIFPEKPDRDTIEDLKAAGFRWCGPEQCWRGEEAKLPERYAAP